MKVTMTPVGYKELQRDLKKMSKEIAEKVKKEAYASGLDVKKQAVDNLKALEAWDTGHLATTILVERSPDGSIVEIGPTAPYGPYVEFGTKPHFPPMDALEDWARRHGMDSAWPICKAISERGTPAQPYLLPAYLSVVGKYLSRLKGLLKA